MHPWLLAFRPKTLTAAVVPVVVGTALAYATHGRVSWLVVSCALLAALFIQVGTNLVNDAMDFEKGADAGERLGPVRVTQAGLLTPGQVLAGGVGSFAVAAVLGVPLVVRGGLPIVVIGVLSLLAGYAYTGGPFPLAYLGLGDPFVILFFGLVAVGGTFYLHTGALDGAALLAGLQVGLLCTVLIAVNNFRDLHGDRKVGKMTLAARFGPAFGRAEIVALTVLPLVLGAGWLVRGWLWAAVLPLVTAPLAVSLLRAVYRNEPGPVYNRLLARSSLLHLAAGSLLAVGFLLA